MPVVPTGSKVLVTGANGYIAVWVCQTLLEKGYRVKGTVRSAEKGKHLESLFKSYGDKFEVVVVPDITKDGAFDDVVDETIDAIEHTASPFHMNADEPKELIEPAVNGTIGILKSAIKNGPNVLRIVVTSSCASIVRVTEEPTKFTEEDWGNQAIEVTERDGRKAPPITKYRASKTLAEKAAWATYKENKSNIKWDLVCINPPFVFGPVIHEVATASALNTSASDFYKVLLTEGSGGKSLEAPGGQWIDVRDVAAAHVLSLEKEDAGDQRMIIAFGTFTWQDVLEAAKSLKLPYADKLQKGVSDYQADKVKHLTLYDNSKGKRILGIRYHTLEETVGDALEDFQKKGWIN